MPKHVFILGLDDIQRSELNTIRNARDYVFHGLLTSAEVVTGTDYCFHDLLQQTRRELQRFRGRVDAIIAQWDFPTSILAPVLCHEFGIPAPPLESVFKCEHKYWSRIEQAKVTPWCIPRFSRFNPFHPRALHQIDLDFPFWIKPIKSFSSQLGFKIHDAREFHHATATIRTGIRNIGNAFDQALTLVELPPEIRESTGTTCIAEEIIHGIQAAPEGSVFQGEFNVHGVFDMDKDATGNSLSRLTYPSRLPDGVQQRMIGICRQFLAHIGFDNGCFNAEFMWDPHSDKLQLIEVNTRISQSHSDMFVKVDGMSNHDVAIDVAQGVRPSMPHRQGKYPVAAQYMIPHFGNAVVTRIPDAHDLQRLRRRFPDTHVRLDVSPGMRLSELRNQNSYRYVLGTLYLGADDHEQLERKFQACLQALPFEFAPLPEATLAGRAGSRLTSGHSGHSGRESP